MLHSATAVLPPGRPSARLRRARYAALALLTTLLGLASRWFHGPLPAWVGLYAGDVLWALLVYWLMGLLAPRAPARRRVGWAGALALAVEFSQLWRAPWLLAWRAHPLGALLLGRGFRWADVLCYVLGVLLGWGLEQWARRRWCGRPGPTRFP
jgi:hypothetical protein